MTKERNIVYPTITRPDVLLGAVPRAFLPVAVIIAAVISVLTQNIIIGAVAFPFVVFVGYIGGRIDPDFVGVWRAKRQWIKRTKGKHKGNYYYA